ncbi:hypothetical protein AADY36_06660 [Pseudoalteromonas sp. D15MCD-2]|uniref:hypothetical protein n=1 Tax=Pseudoalteromonas sp. D15MCD-2 TaxID=3138933 RepID=UPI0031596307
MDIILIIGGIFVVWYLLDNRDSDKTKTKEKRYERFETENGYVEREQTRVFTSSSTKFNVNNEKLEKPIDHIPKVSSNVQQPLEHKPDLISRQEAAVIQRNAGSKTKKCSKCLNNLAISSFGQSERNKDGLTKWCLDCLRADNSRKQIKYKICSGCGKRRRGTSFYHSNKTQDGLTKWCKSCHRG